MVAMCSCYHVRREAYIFSVYTLFYLTLYILSIFFSPETEKGLKKRAKLQAQENGQSCESRENGDGDSDNEPEEVRSLFLLFISV